LTLLSDLLNVMLYQGQVTAVVVFYQQITRLNEGQGQMAPTPLKLSAA